MLRLAQKSDYSRFPVYWGSLDDIQGIVFVKDLFWAEADTKLDQTTCLIIYMSESTSLPQASSLLTRVRLQMSIGLGEFNGTDGLVTLEAILEVVMGKIDDEF